MARSNNTSRIRIPRGAQNQGERAQGSYPPPSGSSGDTGSWKMPDEAEHYSRITYGTDAQGRGHHSRRFGNMSRKGAGSRGGDYAPAGQRNFNMGEPRRSSAKKKIVIGIAVFLVAVIALIGADFALNNGKIHYGVKVEGIDIGGLDKSEAAAELQSKLDSKLTAATVQAQPDVATAARLESRAVAGDSPPPDGVASAQAATVGASLDTEGSADKGPDDGATAESAPDGSTVFDGGTAPEGASSLSWSFTADDLGASVDAASLADVAYEVGQVTDAFRFFPALAERFSSWIGQTDISAEVAFDEAALSAALKPVNEAIGIQMVNSNISVDGEGNAFVKTGQIGEKVDEASFAALVGPALLGDSAHTVAVPMSPVLLDIDDGEAQVVADEVNAAIADPVNFLYEGSDWMVWAPMLGSWVTTTVEGSGNAAKLVASIDTAVAYEGLQALMGDVGYGSAQNAHIDVSSGTPVIVGGTSGIGPDIKTAVDDLQEMLFGKGAAIREITFATAEVEPAVTAEHVASMGVIELINTYQLGYGSGGGSNREYNIERCLDTLNGSLVAPGETWDWNDVVGLCDESTGYKEAGAINEKNELVQEPGGGICNVATGVFNAAYEAGLPILERVNHSQYMANYPDGRDAAVSWTYPTLVFQNDTDRYILVTASYNGTDMFISIWGTSPHRTVESHNSEWAETSDGGWTITNYRKVHASDGSVWIDDSFYSYFPPKKDG